MEGFFATIFKFLFILGAIVGIIYALINRYQKKQRAKIVAEYGEPTWSIGISEILLYDNLKKIVIYKRVIDYKDIIDFSINNGVSYKTSTSTGSSIARGVVGGALFGGIGAAVGAATGKTKTTEQILKYEFTIVVNDINDPSVVYATDEEYDATKLSATLKLIINQNNKGC